MGTGTYLYQVLYLAGGIVCRDGGRVDLPGTNAGTLPPKTRWAGEAGCQRQEQLVP